MKAKILATALLALLPCYAYAAGNDAEWQNSAFTADTGEILTISVLPDDDLQLNRWHDERRHHRRPWRDRYDDDDRWDDDRYDDDDDDRWDDDCYDDDDDDRWDDDRWERDDDDDDD